MPPQKILSFGFRRGKKAGVPHTPLKNGYMIFTTDTEEMYVDIDNKRLTISGAVFCDTEDDIKDIENPADKLYVAKDTRRIMAYNPDISDWIYITTASSGVFYGTCSTLGSEQIKSVSVTANQLFELSIGAVVAVKFANSNEFEATISNPVKMNVNSTGDLNIYYGDSNNPLGTNVIAFGEAGFVCEYMYDGTNWVWIGRSHETIYDITSTSAPGLAPQLEGGSTKYLRADGSWIVPPNTTYGLADTSTSGLMPALSTSTDPVFLDGNGMWSIPVNTTYGAVSTADAGLAPILPASSSGKFLKDTGIWEDLPTRTLTSQEYNTLPEIEPGVVYYITDDGPIIRDNSNTAQTLMNTIQELRDTIASLTARIEELENNS